MTHPRTPARPLDPDPRDALEDEEDAEAIRVWSKYYAGTDWSKFQTLDEVMDDFERSDRRRHTLQGFLAGVVIGLAAGVCGAVVFR